MAHRTAAGAFAALRSDIANAAVFNGKANRDKVAAPVRSGKWLVGINAHYTDT